MEKVKQQQPYTVIDAFTSTPLRGNPAAVIVLQEPLAHETMQLIAREFNLSETAYLVRLPEKDEPETRAYSLRWMTPSVEVKICGHATLASAKALFIGEAKDAKTLLFETRWSGMLKATKCEDGRVQLNFPAGETTPLSGTEEQKIRLQLTESLGNKARILYTGVAKGVSYDDFLLVDIDEGVDLASLNVAIGPLVSILSLAFTNNYSTRPFCQAQIKPYSIILVTQKAGPNEHFRSRVFAPRVGIDEDPVTGSAHCLLGPYWAKKLGKKSGESLKAKQVSKREGDVEIIWDQEKGICYLRGDAAVVRRGTLYF